MSEHRILIVDDSPENLELLDVLMERHGWDRETAESGMAAVARLEEAPFDLVITDLMMPGMNGIELLTVVKERWPATEVVIVTAYGSVPTAVEAIRKGAYAYLLRPFELDEVVNIVRKVFELVAVRSENRLLKEELDQVRGAGELVGGSLTMQRIHGLVETVARTSSTVLITGESGTGKELIARAVHHQSPRAGRPFVKVSCAALPEGLLESELFGHEKGAFTGAVATRKGRFELADGGTLFLDEIGEVSPTVQVKLLRAIQEREFERVGGTRTIATDTRIISATNRDLAEEVRKGTFREDLYYRLNVITIEPPPLRERREDIPQLAYHFLEKFRTDTGKEIRGFTDEALAMIAAYRWPGNVRELQNVVERAVVLCRGSMIGAEDLPDDLGGGRRPLAAPLTPAGVDPRSLIPLKEARAAWEIEYLTQALAACDGNISRTAREIGIARKNLQEKLKAYGIDASSLASGE